MNDMEVENCPIKPTIISTKKFVKAKKLDENLLKAFHFPKNSSLTARGF
jgi:hypothetical protein